MTHEELERITRNVINKYSDVLSNRIEEADTTQQDWIYIGDCVDYTINLFTENGLLSKNGSARAMIGVLKNLVNNCLKQGSVRVEWSEDMDYILLEHL